VKKLKNQQIEQEQQLQQTMSLEPRSQTAIPSYHVLPGAGINAHNLNINTNKKALSILTPLSPLSTLSRS